MKSGADAARPAQPQGGARPQGNQGNQGKAGGGSNAQLSSGALKNDALKKLEQFRGNVKRGQ